MANPAEDVLDMESAVERLGVHQRDPEGKDAVPTESAELEDDPYEGLGDDERVLLGVGGEPMVEVEIDGKKARIAASKLPQAPQVPQYAAPVPQAPPSKLPEMDAIIARLEKDAAISAPMPTTQLMRDDPVAYNDQMALYNEAREKREQASRDLRVAQEGRNQELNMQQQQVILGQQEQLATKWPEWGNQATRPLVAAKLKEYAMRVEGYSDAEATQLSQGIADHRMVLSLRNAMRGEILAKKPDPSRKKARKAPKVGAPGPAQTDTRKKSGERTDFLRKASKEGTNIRDASAFLAGKFS